MAQVMGQRRREMDTSWYVCVIRDRIRVKNQSKFNERRVGEC